MPPKPKPPPPGKDIRSFFGTQPSSSSPSKVSSSKKAHSSQPVPSSTSKQEVIEIDSDGELSAPKKSASTHKSKPVPSEQPSSSKPNDSNTFSSAKEPQKYAKRKKHNVLLSSDDEDETPPKKKAAAANATSTKPKPRPSITKKEDDDFDPMDVDDDQPAKPVKSTSKKGASAKELKASTSEAKGKKVAAEGKQETKKSNWAAMQAARLARGGPAAPGSKEVPDGEPDCLAGLAFVFTGELSSFSREEALDLAKRFGGRVVGQPSSKTDYVVLGEDAGPSKLKAIEKHGLKTLDEDAFLNLIATRKGPGSNGKGLDEKTKKKLQKEQDAIKTAAKEMEQRELEAAKSSGNLASAKNIDPSMQLWTTRYAPQSLKDVCGNKGQVEKLEQWLKDWPTSLKAGFKKPGKNGMNMYRAVLISGSPGIGKTTSAHLCAKLAGFTPIELNASDTRSKKLVENGMNINNTSLDSFVTGRSSASSSTVTLTDRTCLIMDEVDGMSAGDRGGVGALNALIKKTKIPIICIANDRNAQKLKPLMGTTFNLSFQKPQVSMIRSRILSIVFKEKMKIPANVIDQLISGSQSDIRQVLNMLSTWKLSSNSMTFDESKDLAKMNEKYAILSPFDITSKMLGPYLFSKNSRETLGQKMDYYFQDHSFVPLFIQENYLKTQPSRIRDLDGPDKVLKHLKLMDEAASSLSDADLVDGMIHGSEQHWSLMPLHAVCSTVRPASCLYGPGVHYGGPNAMSFPQWLGQNSKQNKLSRQLGDVQTHMRLKVSGDKSEIRQSYVPAIYPSIVQPLIDEGSNAIEDVIQTMDEYYLSREDWDTIVELGVDNRKDELVLKKIPAAVKSSFTRKYNSSDHPIPFHKAQDLGKVPKKLAAEAIPDLEEAFDLDEAVDEVSDDDQKNGSKDSDDVRNDKLIKAPKKKAAAKSTKAKK
ncbi:hypothetical protein D9758_003145 [Tetrapyrgos nigripes]|uniref:Replication factor C subunit 1 n=1 Tax=Tetrapyrgos nigripes TaxID=182062 RepID=A0A8H5LPX7_9AGAR|nr:hypothetical protein D9758_003145 [Tetrapyrgos nigripes]